jgi:hypothetical protein
MAGALEGNIADLANNAIKVFNGLYEKDLQEPELEG